MDIGADGHWLHTATIGLFALALAVLRVRLDGRYGGTFSALSGAIVAQPALHAMTELTVSGTGDPVGHVAETSMSVLPILLSSLVVAVVIGAQRLFTLLALRPLIALLHLLFRVPSPAGTGSPRPMPRSVPQAPKPHLGAVATRRGPPLLAAVAF
ncbi:hypothetical protein SK571_03715 [Lentzea sp. BCCO 10_0798]|uniref:Uncharacterized protein n=1 Tax=Lentzea kristufekii TaxID=3095430 RepID=A0ABU4TK51_9PSEU|nr:hypothetical protein [Lentzea sp. BCCO 10_0798]MDX8048478.1 hypothetical protein [Lentzea sp. BCCO 10_0798]